MKGVRIKNNDGYVQIDSRYKNTALVSTGTLSGTGYVEVFVPNGCVAAVRPDLPALCLQYQAAGGYTLRVRVGPDKASGNAKINVEYYIFGPPERATPNGTHGVIIRSESGAVSFDSRLKYMNVLKVDAASGTYPKSDSGIMNNEPGPTSEVFVRDRLLANRYREIEVSGKKLAAIVATPRFMRTVTWPFGPPSTTELVQYYTVSIEAECVMCKNNNIRLYNVLHAINRWEVPTSEEPPDILSRNGSGTIIVDVTGY